MFHMWFPVLTNKVIYKQWLLSRPFLWSKVFTHPPPILGRWGIEKCHTKIDKKVDWANEDHCGPCGTSGLNKPK